MKSFRIPFLAALFLAAVPLAGAGAADPVKPDVIRIPDLPAPSPIPQPIPGPNAVGKLTADQLYVIDSDVPVIVLSSPAGIVATTEESGPLKIRGIFFGGNGKAETRTFKGKHIFTVEVLQTGRVELLIIPVGADSADKVIRRTVDVDSGHAPIPPPDPPKPDPKPTPINASVWMIVVEETSERTALTAKVLGDLAYWNSIKTRGSNWRFYDKDSPDAIAKKYPTMVSGATLPALLILSADGEKIKAVPLPKTTTEVDTLFREVTGK